MQVMGGPVPPNGPFPGAPVPVQGGYMGQMNGYGGSPILGPNGNGNANGGPGSAGNSAGGQGHVYSPQMAQMSGMSGR